MQYRRFNTPKSSLPDLSIQEMTQWLNVHSGIRPPALIFARSETKTCPNPVESLKEALLQRACRGLNMQMTRIFHFAKTFGIAALLFAALLGVSVAAPQSAGDAQFTPASDQTPLTSGQIHDLITRTIANQHRDDAELDTFERVEQQLERSASSPSRVILGKTFRVVPTGSGNIRILIKDRGKPVPTANYQRDLHTWQSILTFAVNPKDPRQVASLAKQKKKLKDRAGLVDAVPNAFNITWIGRDLRDGRPLEKFRLEPNPAYVRRGNSTDWLVHARATVWIDAQAAQVAYIEAVIIRDISIGAGIFGKVYHGGHFVMDQAEASAGLWEPVLFQYDISGRKFLFPFEMHVVTKDSRYRFIGTPDQALAIVRQDLAVGGSFTGDPKSCCAR
jgi:hypothetical protein